MTVEIVNCPECGKPMALKPSVYGQFYACTDWPNCRGSHGASPDGKPLGTPANSRTKRARIVAHEVFEKMRLSRGMTKSQAYAWLSNCLSIPGKDCHMSHFTEEQCKTAEKMCRDGIRINEILPSKIARMTRRKNNALLSAGKYEASGDASRATSEFRKAGRYESIITILKTQAGHTDWQINAISAISCLLRSGDIRLLSLFRSRLKHLGLKLRTEGFVDA